MSNKIIHQVWECIDVPPTEQHLLNAHADNCNDNGEVFIGVERLAWKTGLSERTIHSFRKRWMKIGAFRLVGSYSYGTKEITRTAPGKTVAFGRGMVPVYQLNLSVFPAKVPWEGRKGATVAPFQKGANQSEKGANHAIKGANERNAIRKKNPIKNPQENLFGNGASPLPALPQEPQDQREPGLLKVIRQQWPKNCRCDLTAADMTGVRRMLRARHRWTEQELAVCIVARFASVDYIDPGESVKAWIGAIADYQTGPKDRFGKPLYRGAALDEWRDQARVILYGPQPVQQKLPQPAQPQEPAISPEKMADAIEAAGEVLRLRAAKKPADDARRKIGRAIGTMSADAIDAFIRSRIQTAGNQVGAA